MAWLQNLAGRAEDLLNKIDQNAATVLNDSTYKLVNEDSFEKNSLLGQNDFSETVNRKFSNDSSLEVEETMNVSIEDAPEMQKSVDNEDKSVSGSPASKSLSSRNSFIFSEDAQHCNEKISKLELEVRDLNKELLNFQHLCAELRNENINLRTQIETANGLVSAAQSEMEQYKARAQRILQEKENLISLKEEKSENNDNILTNYNEELKKEVDFQQNKNKELSEKVKKMSKEIALLQQQIVLTQNSSQQAIHILQENLNTEKKVRLMAEEECRQKNQELEQKVQELMQQNYLIQTKNEEINNLREALKSRKNSDNSFEFEARLKSLTDTLMLKQNTLEAVTTERNALRIQLEKLESEYQKNLAQLERARVHVINVNDTDDVKSQVPHFMRVSPLDAGMTRRVKHAYSTLDAVSIRTGIFLRRYPVARVFVFCYMVLLHFWALVLLFLYAPSNR